MADYQHPDRHRKFKRGDGNDVINNGAKVVNVDGEDVTINFIRGVRETLKMCKKLKIRKAVLKERSPSCGVNFIYDGSFSGKLRKGAGVTAALLKVDGIEIISDEKIEELL